MNITQKVKAIGNLIEDIKNHCMCADFQDLKYHYLVIFPVGFQIDGVRISKGMGKIKALSVLLERLEREWKSSFLH